MQMKESDKATKNVGSYVKALKLLLFFGVVSTLFYQLWFIDWKRVGGLELDFPIALVGSIALVVLNLWFEFLKWRIIAKNITDDSTAIKSSFWSGIASGFLTPNGWGSFLGRLLYFRKRDQVYIVISTAFANLSQLLPTLVFGMVAAIAKFPEFQWFFIVGGIVLVSLYLFVDLLIPRKKINWRVLRQFRLHKKLYSRLKLPLLIFSTLRFVVFSCQFVLLFVAFGYTEVFELFPKVWLIYFITAFVPSLWSGKILIRETAALFVFKDSGVEIPDIIVASLLIYLINIALPAVWSSTVWLPRQLKK